MNRSLNSGEGVIYGITEESILGIIKGDTRSLDDGSYRDDIGSAFPYSLLRTSKSKGHCMKIATSPTASQQ